MSLFALVSIIVTLAAFAAFINARFIRLPTTIGVILLALAASVALNLAAPLMGSFRSDVASYITRIEFGDVVLHGMLAFLLFAGSIHVDLADLRAHWLPITLLAFVGTLASTFIVGGLAWWALGALGLPIPFLHALLFGALISPTDPISVLGIMKSVGANKALETQLAGESLVNDGIGVVIFLVLLEISGLSGQAPDAHAVATTLQAAGSATGEMGAGNVAVLLLREIGGALVVGLAAGTVAYAMLKSVDNYQVEVLITLALAMGVYALADALHLSAPIAVVVAGVLTGNKGRADAMSEKTEKQVDTFWELIDEILNAVLFLLIGAEMLVVAFERSWLIAGAAMVPIVLLARAVCVVGIMVPLSRATPQPRGAVPVLTWGSLRGGISVALALSLPDADSRSLLITLTYCVVIFSIVVQGLTIGKVIRKTADCDAPPSPPPAEPATIA